jgi:hypothetical protein
MTRCSTAGKGKSSRDVYECVGPTEKRWALPTACYLETEGRAHLAQRTAHRLSKFLKGMTL